MTEVDPEAPELDALAPDAPIKVRRAALQLAGQRPLLALNMIVRGGGENLAKALASVRGICDEFVIAVDSRSWPETKGSVGYPEEIDTALNGPLSSLHGFPSLSVSEDGTSCESSFPDGPRVLVFRHDWCADPDDPDDVGTGFAAARQAALDRTTASMMMWIDSDDEWEEDEPGITRAYAKNLLDNGRAPADHPDRFASWAARYVYSRTKEGRPGVVHNRERLFRVDDNWAWQDLIHETPTTGKKETLKYAEKVRAIHAQRDDDSEQGRSRDRRNLKALYRQLIGHIRIYDSEERVNLVKLASEQIRATGFLDSALWGNAAAWTESARAVQYIAFQHYAHRRFEQAEFWFRAFLDWPKHGEGRAIEKPDEWETLIHLGRTILSRYREVGAERTIDPAENVYLRAQKIVPYWPDHWLGLADCAALRKDWGMSRFYNETGRRLIKQGSLPHALLFVNMLDYELVPCLQMQDIEYHQGNVEEALRWCEEGLKIDPSHKVLADYRQQYADRLIRENVAGNAANLLEFMIDRDDLLRARNLSVYLPEEIKAEPAVAEYVEMAKVQTEHLTSKQSYADFYETQGEGEWEFPEPDPERDDPDLLRANDRYAWLAERIPAGARALDLGCADGHYHPVIMDKVSELVAVDVSKRALEIAGKRAEIGGYTDRVSFIRGLVEDVLAETAQILEERGGKPFDVCLIGELIEHVIDPGALYLAAERVAKTVLLTTPEGSFGKGGYASHDLKPRGHVRTFTKESLFEFLDERPNRHVVELHSAHHDYSHGWLMSETRIGQPEADETLPGAGKLFVIFCGPGFENWTPDTYRRRGLGGSETAVVCTARELARLGWRVVVYAEADGVWDGVLYRHWSKIEDYGGGADYLLLWRSPVLLNGIKEGTKIAERVGLWVHDMTCGPDLTPAIARRIDDIFYLSEWHRRHLIKNYPYLLGGSGLTADELFAVDTSEVDPQETHVTREKFDAWLAQGPFPAADYPRLVRMVNGIDHWPEDGSDLVWADALGTQLITAFDRNPHRIMWASSPDRGLDEMLRYWPQIRREWPDAELHAFYGWETVEKWLASDERLAAFKKAVMAKIEEGGGVDGVHWHGRVSARKLREEWAKSGYFLYPAIPDRIIETFCISVIEAQSAGCIPIVKDAGSLREVVGAGGVVVPWARASLPELFEIAKKIDRQRRYGEALRVAGWGNQRMYTWARAAMIFHEAAVEGLIPVEATVGDGVVVA